MRCNYVSGKLFILILLLLESNVMMYIEEGKIIGKIKCSNCRASISVNLKDNITQYNCKKCGNIHLKDDMPDFMTDLVKLVNSTN